jgi:hypothetical protein
MKVEFDRLDGTFSKSGEEVTSTILRAITLREISEGMYHFIFN